MELLPVTEPLIMVGGGLVNKVEVIQAFRAIEDSTTVLRTALLGLEATNKALKEQLNIELGLYMDLIAAASDESAGFEHNMSRVEEISKALKA